MAEQRLLQLADDELGAALRGLAPAVAWPDARLAPDGPDLATRVRARLVAAPPARRGSTWRLRPVLVLAIVALLVLAAVAGAVAFGVPGHQADLRRPGRVAAAGRCLADCAGVGRSLGAAGGIEHRPRRAGRPWRPSRTVSTSRSSSRAIRHSGHPTRPMSRGATRWRSSGRRATTCHRPSSPTSGC